jgi:transcriptional regulator NrdR family protein
VPVRCTSCVGPTPVIDSRRRPDGTTRRRRECTECGRRFTSLEVPAPAGGPIEIPDPNDPKEGVMEAVRRRAILHSEWDDAIRRHKAAVTELRGMVDDMRSLLVEAREEVG